jgi:hypothetical protein
MRCVCGEGELYLLIYTNPWSVWRRSFWKPPWTDVACCHATAYRRWAWKAVVGVRAHPWCGRTRAVPYRHWLHAMGCWMGLDHPHVGARPRFVDWMGLCIYFLCIFLHYAFCFAPFALFSTCIWMCVLQNMFLLIQVELCQSICIYIKSLFISPVLHSNWRSDLIISDHQQEARHIMGVHQHLFEKSSMFNSFLSLRYLFALFLNVELGCWWAL